MTSPTSRHQLLASAIERALFGSIDQPAEGYVLRAVDVKLSSHRAPNPDVCVFLRGGLAQMAGTHLEGPPDLVVEVLSPGSHEKDLKRNVAWFAEHGVQEYWVASSDRPRLRVYRREAGKFKKPQTYEAGDVLTTPLLPSLAVPVGSLYEGLPPE